MSDASDFLVAGAGIVGLATAWELKRRHPSARITVLDKEPRPGLHASGRNSGVLHSGIYYASDTLKAKVCAKGAARMRDFAAEHGVSCEKRGKVVIPTSAAELPSLERLFKNARDNGIRVEKMDEKGIRSIEPHARPFQAGLYSPDTAVIDSLGVVNALCGLLQGQGVEILFGREVSAADPARKQVSAGGETFSYGFLVNCAGAHADVIARRFGLCRDHALVPFKGLYYKLNPAKDALVKSNIYPVPDLFLPFLGVHLTRVISGDVYIGPTAIPALGRENYGLVQGLKVGESLGVLWRLMGLYWRDQRNFRRLVHAELGKYVKSHFFACARRLVDGLEIDDLLPSSKAGIRPQLVNVREGRLEMDYILESTDSSLHVLNAISPAFTSAFAFAELIADRQETAAGRLPVPARS